MRIPADFYAVFWTRPGWAHQCHADIPKAVGSPSQALAFFRQMFPDDVVCSIRDGSGRFLGFAS